MKREHDSLKASGASKPLRLLETFPPFPIFQLEKATLYLGVSPSGHLWIRVGLGRFFAGSQGQVFLDRAARIVRAH